MLPDFDTLLGQDVNDVDYHVRRHPAVTSTWLLEQDACTSLEFKGGRVKIWYDPETGLVTAITHG